MIIMQTEQSPYDAKIWTKSYDSHVKPTLEYPNESLGEIFDNSGCIKQRIPETME